MQADNFRQHVIDFVNVARRRAGFATDPRQLGALENAAITTMHGAHGGLGAPVAVQTWEARTLLLGSQKESERVQVNIAWPCLIVGGFAVLEPVDLEDEAIIPDTSSIDVRVSLLSHEEMTTASGTTRPIVSGQIQKDGVFCNLQMFSVNGGAILRPWLLPYQTAQLGVEFRWKRGPTGDPTPYRSSHVGVSFFVRPLRLR